jgi:hypothetical protein
MIWRMPWAWIGLAAVAVPIVIHLLGRRRVRHQPFPSLRFLDVAKLLPARRHRISDVPLLLVRAAVLAAAVGALAQPFLLTASRRQDLGRAVAVVVDTSASMARITSGGTPALEAARAEAKRISAEATTSTMVESSQPARAIAGAVAWLETRPGRRELAVVSDFQTGTIDATAIDAVPPQLGIRLVKVDGPFPAAAETVTRHGAISLSTRVTPGSTGIAVEWTPVRAAAEAETPLLLAGAAERPRAEAALAAAASLGSPAGLADRPVAILYPESEDRAAVLRAARPLTQPWMADAVARLRRDPLLSTAADEGVPAPGAAPEVKPGAGFTTVAASRDGRPLVLAAAADVQGRERLVFVCLADAGSLTSAALDAALRGVAPGTPASEIEPTQIAEATLESWRREPGASAPPDARDPAGPSDGRWLWALALVLLAFETWMRRDRRVVVPEMIDERVA